MPDASTVESPPASPDAESLLDTRGAAASLSLSRRTLETWRWEGKGPRWIRFSLGAVRYRRADLIDFIQAHEAVEPTDKRG